jgi:hypothetical protein
MRVGPTIDHSGDSTPASSSVQRRAAVLLSLTGVGLFNLILVRDLVFSENDSAGFGPSQIAGLIVCGLLVFLGALLYIGAGRSKRFNQVVMTIGSTILTIAFVALLAELFYHPGPSVAGWKGNPVHAATEFNQLSYRGRKIAYEEDDFVVVLLGDSQVAGPGVSYYWMPERRLEQYLNEQLALQAKVFTIGAGGYGQDQELLALEEYYASGFRANAVVLWMTPQNDIFDNIFPTHFPTNGIVKPTFWLEDGALRGPTYQIGEDLYGSSSIMLVQLLERALLSSRILDDSDWESLYLPPAYEPLSEYEGKVIYTWQESLGGPEELSMGQDNLKSEKTRVSLYLTPRSERMQYAIDLERALFDRIEALVTEHGGRFLLFNTNAPGSQIDDGIYALKGAYYQVSQAQFDRNVRDLVDGYTGFTISVTIELWRTSPTDSHLNDVSVDQVMHDLAVQIAPLLASNAKR